MKPTPPQTSLTRRERLKNLRKCFAVATPSAIEGKNMLVVDDVFTTGTTVNECAKALRKAGAQAVYVQTLARMVAHEH
jgi:predicted amidophosphoribosyltransferase